MPRGRLLLVPVLLVALFGLGAAGLSWQRARHPERQFERGLKALESGRLPEVLDALRRIGDAPDYESHAALLRGGVLLRSGEPETALRELARLRPEGRVRAPAMLLTGECLYRLGRLTESETVLRQLVTEQPESADGWRWLGALYYDLGAMNEAGDALERVVQLDSGDFRPHRLLGLIHLDFEQYGPAADHYRRALELEPPPEARSDLRLELGQALMKERQYADALEVLAPEASAAALVLAAECRWSLAQRGQARAMLDEALRHDPHERTALLLQARFALEEGRPREAVTPLEQALDQDPHDFLARYQLAQALRQLGQAGRSEAELSRMRESQDLRQRLTALSEEAIARPRDPEVRDQLADVCRALGKHELAVVWKRAAEACRHAAAHSPRDE